MPLYGPVPALDPQPSDFGLVAWTADPGSANASATLPLGSLVMAEFFVRGGLPTIATVAVQTTVLQAGTSSQNFIGIYDSTGTLKGQTADQTAAWGAAAGIKAAALTSAYTSVPAGRYYLAALVNGATSPTFRISAATINMANANVSGANLRYATYSSALTALPGSITLANMVVTNGVALAGLVY